MSRSRTIKTVQEIVKPLEFPEREPLRNWLDGQAKLFGLTWLLAHADDGVIWGRFEDGALITAREATDDPYSGPAWRDVTLQQARAFSESAEVLLWREDGETWRARVIRAVREEETPDFREGFDETRLLWGLPEETMALAGERFTRLRHGGIGCAHVAPIAIPAPEGKSTPAASLVVRNYLNASGPARVIASRLAGFAFQE